MSYAKEHFSSIILGKSPLTIKGIPAYAKHYGFFNSVETDLVYKRELKRAKESGIDSESNRIAFLYREELWSEEKENKIGNLKASISRTRESKKNILLPSHKRIVNENIKNLEMELLDLEIERSSLVGKTQEFFARQESEIYFILNTIYKDSELTELFIDPKDQEDIDQEDIYDLINAYNSCVEPLLSGGVKKIAISHEAQTLVSLSGSAYEFYGKPISLLTFFQSELYIYTKNYGQMMNYEISPSEEISSDPEKLEDWFASVTNSKRMNGDREGNVSYVGASVEDIKELTGGAEIFDMDAEIKKSINNNGVVDMQTMMKMKR